MSERHSFRSLNNIPLHLYTILVYSFIKLHLECLHILAVAKNAGTTMSIQISFWDSVLIFFDFIVYSITVVPIFFPFCTPPPSPSLSPINPLSIVYVHGSFIHVLWLVVSPSFHHYCPSKLPSGHCQSFPCSHASGSIFLASLFCSLDSSYKWGHMVPAFPDWLISLSIIVSNSIPATTKGKNSFFFFFYHCLVFHCVNVPHCFCAVIYWWVLGLFANLGYHK